MTTKDLREFDSLAPAQNALTDAGFTEQFDTKEGKIMGIGNKKDYKPEDLLIVADARFEGMTNPGDNMILYAIEANDGTKGTMVDNMGAADNAQDPELVKAIPIKNAEDKE